MADPTLPNDPNTQNYKSDFLAGKFAESNTINTPTQFGPAVTSDEDAGRAARTQAIAAAQGNPGYVLGGSQNFLEDDSPLSRENSLRDRQFESQFGSGAVQSHFDAASANENYHALAARHTRLLNHAHVRADSGDYLNQSSQIDPTSETALEEHINNKTLFPGALGNDVDASDQHFANIYNQHQRATGQGWNTVQSDIKAGLITPNDIKRLPDGSVDYYSTHMLANEQGGALARQKQDLSAETPEAKMFAKALDIHKIPEPDVFIPGSKNLSNPEHEKWAQQKAWADSITDQFIAAHPNLALPKTRASAAPTGPSEEFKATEKRFKTPGQVESIPRTAPNPAYKGTALTDTDQVNQLFTR